MKIKQRDKLSSISEIGMIGFGIFGKFIAKYLSAHSKINLF